MRSGPAFNESVVSAQRDASLLNPLQIEATVDSNYQVGPGDFFEILLPYNSVVSQVSPEGYLSVPGCGLVKINQLKLPHAKSEIRNLLKTRYDANFVGVLLVQLRKMRVNVLGALVYNGQTVIDGQTRLSLVLRNMGGVLQVADKEHVLIVRKSDTLFSNLILLEKGDLSQDPFLEQGDLIVVPFQRLKPSITLRTADGTASVGFVDGRTLEDYLTSAGFERIRDPGYQTVRISHRNGLIDWMSVAQAKTVVLQVDDDVEFLMRKPFVYVGGAVAGMGQVEYRADWHALDYIAHSGVTIVTGSWSRVSVVRDGKSFSVDPAKTEIRPGDYIEIPRSLYESTKDLTLFLASLLSVIATAVIIQNY